MVKIMITAKYVSRSNCVKWEQSSMTLEVVIKNVSSFNVVDYVMYLMVSKGLTLHMSSVALVDIQQMHVRIIGRYWNDFQLP